MSFESNLEVTHRISSNNCQKLIQCEICPKTFTRPSNYRRHLSIHTNEKPFECDKCGQRFRCAWFLKEHKYKHLSSKLFVCGVCNGTFTHRTTLRHHLFVHSGEKPLKCEICGKRFVKNYNLKLHRRLHTGNLPFECVDCKKKFNTKANLASHSFIHTGIYPFTCDVCCKGFRKKNQLLQHYVIHSESSNKEFSKLDPIQKLEDHHSEMETKDSLDSVSLEGNLTSNLDRKALGQESYSNWAFEGYSNGASLLSPDTKRFDEVVTEICSKQIISDSKLNNISDTRIPVVPETGDSYFRKNQWSDSPKKKLLCASVDKEVFDDGSCSQNLLDTHLINFGTRQEDAFGAQEFQSYFLASTYNFTESLDTSTVYAAL